FLAAKTTVVAKSAPTPAGSGSHGVGGVSTSRGPGVGPNGASSRGLANTGARVNPVALTQLGLLALLVGGGLLVATRRRARKH
ncbi:MAG TPA: LPXTG cell wall anchor domain-containing protein, partial [Jatrophihabitantaceae bacterium]|nr:LPXTG cell wall anchor domain-containing protein [Jatrophihabitantaceae bacterium]